MWAIETRDLTKTYKEGFFFRKPKLALDHLDLQVASGEIFGYIGHNGAGKTTTFKLLLGLIRPTSGEAHIFGESIRNPETRRRVGFLPEHPYFYEHLTAVQFLDFYAQLFDMDRAQRKRRIEELLERVGLSHAASTTLRHFSKGMLQRIGLAQALINDPDVVILDEPMAGLDPVGRKEVREIILDLKEHGKTVLFSSHILADVEMICDRVGILAHGRLMRVEETQRLLDSGHREYELVVRDLDEQAMQKLRKLALEIQPRGEGAVVVVPDEASAERAQEIVREHRARLVALTPRLPSLESLFLSEVQGRALQASEASEPVPSTRVEEKAA